MPSSVQSGRTRALQFFISAADLAAKTTQYVVAPSDGFIERIEAVVQTAIVTGGTIGASNQSGAVTGLSAAVANGAAVGTVVSVTVPKGAPNREVKKGQRIAITLTAFTGGGAVNGNIVLRDTADPQNVMPY